MSFTNKFLRRYLLGIMLAAAGAIVVGVPAQALTPEEIKANGKVRIGVLVDFAPFGFLDANNLPVGYDVEVAKDLANAMGVEAEITPVTGPNRIPYLLSGRLDVLVAALAITPTRAEQVSFSEPYAGMRNILYARKNLDISSYDKLSGVSVAVDRAGAADLALTAAAPKDIVLQRYDDAASAIQALLSGQADGIGVSELVVPQLLERDPGLADIYDEKLTLTVQAHGIAVRPDDKELLAWVNSFVEDEKSSGRLDAIHQKWLNAYYPDYKVPAAK